MPNIMILEVDENENVDMGTVKKQLQTQLKSYNIPEYFFQMWVDSIVACLQQKDLFSFDDKEDGSGESYKTVFSNFGNT